MADEVYLHIAAKIDQGPLGAPKAGGNFSPAFIAYLKLLYAPLEAELVQHLEMPYRFKKVPDLAKDSGKPEPEVKEILDRLAAKGHILGFKDIYALPQMDFLVNIHQFRMKLQPEDLEAAKLYQQFFIKDGFYKYYESSEQGTSIMRVIPVGRALEARERILATEEAHEIIKAAKNFSLVPCPCRTRTEKTGTRECKDHNPVGSCIMMESSALYFSNLGMGKKVDAVEAGKYLDEMQELGLVAITENFRDAPHTVICLCCGCCCSQVRGRTRWENPTAVSPSNFVPEASEECILCGKCADRCFFHAVSLDEEKGRAMVDANKCLGCGVCAIGCEQEAMRLKRSERAEPLANARELYGRVARENRKR